MNELVQIQNISDGVKHQLSNSSSVLLIGEGYAVTEQKCNMTHATIAVFNCKLKVVLAGYIHSNDLILHFLERNKGNLL